MSDFWIYFNMGLNHLLNVYAYIDILFLLALTAPYEIKSWKSLLILISLFTLGHTLALLLCVFNIVTVKTGIIALLAPINIFIVALYNIIMAGKLSKKSTITFIAVVTSLFGILHGLGFSNYFNRVLTVKPTDKLLPLFEFGLGFGISQIIVALLALSLAFVVQTLFKFSKRDWMLTISAFIVGVVIPMILQSEIWRKY